MKSNLISFFRLALIGMIPCLLMLSLMRHSTGVASARVLEPLEAKSTPEPTPTATEFGVNSIEFQADTGRVVLSDTSVEFGTVELRAPKEIYLNESASVQVIIRFNTPTPTATATITPTATLPATATGTLTPTPTATATFSPTPTPTPLTATLTAIAKETPTPTPTTMPTLEQPIGLFPRMSAEIIGANFDISSATAKEQILVSEQEIYWNWTITATQEGPQYLDVVVAIPVQATNRQEVFSNTLWVTSYQITVNKNYWQKAAGLSSWMELLTSVGGFITTIVSSGFLGRWWGLITGRKESIQTLRTTIKRYEDEIPLMPANLERENLRQGIIRDLKAQKTIIEKKRFRPW